MNKKFIYGLGIFLFFITCFLSFIFISQTGYDLWILDGIIFPTLAFVIFSVAAEMLVEDNKKLVIIAAIFVAVINIIPAFKYSLFYGVFDTPAHYRFAEQIALLGYVPETEFYSWAYGENSGMHIFWASFSIITKISMNDVFRFVIPLSFGLLPFVTYFVGKKFLSDKTLRYAIIASSFPLVDGYGVWGTSLAFLLYFLLGAVYLRLICTQTHKNVFSILFLVLSFTLITSHTVTAFFFLIILLGFLFIGFLLPKIKSPLAKSFSSLNLSFPVLLYSMLLFTWWMFRASYNLDSLANFLSLLTESTVNKAVIPGTFFQIPFLSQIKIFIALNMVNAIAILFGLIGLSIFLWGVRKRQFLPNTSTFYSLILVFIGVLGVALVVQFISNFGDFSYQRILIYIMPWCVFLIGLVFTRLDNVLSSLKLRTRKIFLGFLITLLISCCIIQFFPCQPLVPRASALSSNLPEDDYVIDLHQVNTATKVSMILFAEAHSEKGSIVTDSITRAQSYGFSDSSFSFRIQYPSPFLDLNSTQNFRGPFISMAFKDGWDVFLLRTSKAGPFKEGPQYRNDETLQNLRFYVGNTVYDNGDTFIITHLDLN